MKNRVAHLLALACGVLLALPPRFCCVLGAGTCCHPAPAAADEPAPACRGCCDAADPPRDETPAPARGPATPDKPCCCHAHPTVPATAEKADDHRPDATAELPLSAGGDALARGRGTPTAAGPGPRPHVPRHVLHCVWRC